MPECVTNLCGNRGGARVTWRSSAPVGGAVDVQQDYTILDGGVFILMDVYLTNTTVNDLTDVYYMRNVDPDNDVTRHGDYTTTNIILNQPDGVNDLAVVRAVSHRVLVMKGGDVVEQGEAQALFEAPQQTYTRELLAAAHLA